MFRANWTVIAEILDDVRDECSKFGTIVGLKIPRPSGGSRQSAGVGKIFVKYENREQAKKALQALAGRKFADRTVVTTYFPEVGFPLLFHSSCLSCILGHCILTFAAQENFEVGAW
jgi:hypothetical protein